MISFWILICRTQTFQKWQAFRIFFWLFEIKFLFVLYQMHLRCTRSFCTQSYQKLHQKTFGTGNCSKKKFGTGSCTKKKSEPEVAPKKNRNRKLPPPRKNYGTGSSGTALLLDGHYPNTSTFFSKSIFLEIVGGQYKFRNFWSIIFHYFSMKQLFLWTQLIITFVGYDTKNPDSRRAIWN